MTTDSTVMPCMIAVICLGSSALDSGVWTRVHERPEEGGEGDADRVVAAEQGDGDAGEAEAADHRHVGVAAGGAHDVVEADQPGDGARQEHGGDDHALGVDAAGRGRLGVGAGGPQVEAEAGAPDRGRGRRRPTTAATKMYDCTRVASGRSMPMPPSSPLSVGSRPDSVERAGADRTGLLARRLARSQRLEEEGAEARGRWR